MNMFRKIGAKLGILNPARVFMHFDIKFGRSEL